MMALSQSATQQPAQVLLSKSKASATLASMYFTECQKFVFRITDYEVNKCVIASTLQRGFSSNCLLINSPG